MVYFFFAVCGLNLFFLVWGLSLRAEIRQLRKQLREVDIVGELRYEHVVRSIHEDREALVSIDNRVYDVVRDQVDSAKKVRGWEIRFKALQESFLRLFPGH